MSNGQKLVDRINGIQLDPELLMGALGEIAAMDPADRATFDGRTITVVRYVHEQGFSGDEGIDASMSINFRLMALAALRLPNFPEWRISSDEGYDLLSADVIRCAAVEPLVREGEEVRFDPASFEKRLAGMSPLGVESRFRQAIKGRVAR